MMAPPVTQQGLFFMKKIVCICFALVAVSGCASTERLDALEQQLSSVQRTADQALDVARQAQAKASDNASDVGEAQRMARQAMDTATETAERLRRMEDECCGGK